MRSCPALRFFPRSHPAGEVNGFRESFLRWPLSHQGRWRGASAGLIMAFALGALGDSTDRQLSPSSRGTPLIISEIMYHPRDAGGTETLEYIEIFNTEPVAENLGGYQISGSVSFTFPPVAMLAGRSFVVVARNPEALRQAANITNVVGPYSGALPNDGGRVRCQPRRRGLTGGDVCQPDALARGCGWRGALAPVGPPGLRRARRRGLGGERGSGRIPRPGGSDHH